MDAQMGVNRSRFKLLAVLGILVAGISVALISFRLVTFAMMPMKPGAQEGANVELQRGDGPREITRSLIQAGAISSSDLHEMLWLGRLTRKWGQVKAGEYRVTPAMTPLEIFSTITSGISIAHPLTVREGIATKSRKNSKSKS